MTLQDVNTFSEMILGPSMVDVARRYLYSPNTQTELGYLTFPTSLYGYLVELSGQMFYKVLPQMLLLKDIDGPLDRVRTTLVGDMQEVRKRERFSLRNEIYFCSDVYACGASFA